MTPHTRPIVIVGGGAGGLELACKLGRKFGPELVTLVDPHPFHIWKPTLHEVAAGTVDLHHEALSYAMLAHDNRFTFVLGSMTGLDLAGKSITVSAVEIEPGAMLMPERRVAFAKLCMAVGSICNHHGVPGAEAHAIALTSHADAERFRRTLIRRLVAAAAEKDRNPDAAVKVVIIGGGATGVELAAELRDAASSYADYGERRLDPVKDVHITILESGARVLRPLPERVSRTANRLLKRRRIEVVPYCRVARIEADAVVNQTGLRFAADLCVWAAGIQAPEFLRELGLPTNRVNQLEVTDRLHSTATEDVYALGDCAACVMPDGSLVPARAQAAHQQAQYLFDTFCRQLQGRRPPARGFRYRDSGSLVSIGQRTSVGSLVGSFRGASWFIQGTVARWLYLSLHLMHHRELVGAMRMLGLAVARRLMRRSTAQVKLH
ncbi:FAD-dependent oxidoreductase [Roseateles sp. SL47]|uniref:NAD(P)/FAD-dependent oxidoreductase n=1 Tax=Roseateles sp. SL47 TaxID=2995138 RepID=UPI00226E0C3B|nr:FAD-dependent oxidoreductase [Roseateles sp. SL47]WAC75387.1 FAD-dependent oxidoreductase [Roseateles sp. SL47]